MQAVTGIPDVRAGDSVWWHCDMVHGVAPVTDQKGWGNVMYIPAAPWCPRNAAYAVQVRDGPAAGPAPATSRPSTTSRRGATGSPSTTSTPSAVVAWASAERAVSTTFPRRLVANAYRRIDGAARDGWQ